MVSGPGLHRVAPGVEQATTKFLVVIEIYVGYVYTLCDVLYSAILQVLVDCSGPQNEPKNENTGLKHKSEALISALEVRSMPRTLIFCNTITRKYNRWRGLNLITTTTTHQIFNLSLPLNQHLMCIYTIASFKNQFNVSGCREVENTLRRYYHGKKYQPIILAYHKAIDPNALKTNLKYTLPICYVTCVLCLLCSDLRVDWLVGSSMSLINSQAIYEAKSDPSRDFDLY